MWGLTIEIPKSRNFEKAVFAVSKKTELARSSSSRPQGPADRLEIALPSPLLARFSIDITGSIPSELWDL
jgi:hypothetical protein